MNFKTVIKEYSGFFLPDNAQNSPFGMLVVTHACTIAWACWKLRGLSEERRENQEKSQGSECSSVCIMKTIHHNEALGSVEILNLMFK